MAEEFGRSFATLPMGQLICGPIIAVAQGQSELIGKVVFALFVVPVYGYFAVCICEPVTWVVCCIFILVFLFLTRRELKDTTEGDYINETV